MVCWHLCDHVVLLDLLANKETFSKAFLNYYVDKETDAKSKKSLELLANNLIDQVKKGNIYVVHPKKHHAIEKNSQK